MKIVWGYEPKSQNNEAAKGMVKLLGQFASGTYDINIGCVVTENEVYLHPAHKLPPKERFSKYPKDLILADLKSAKIQLKPSAVHILHHRTLSTTAAVDQLLGFAKARRAKLIALFTHNRTGIKRLVMGSFAETAVHRSQIDLLLAGPKTQFPDRVRNVLFASDFAPDSKRDLRRVLELCKRMGARLTVFHAARITSKWSPLNEDNPEIQAFRRMTRKMVDWIETECKKADVPCSIVIKVEFESISDLALKAARKAKADLIVVSAKVGPLAALMGGSVTRNIVRLGSHPVLILKK